MPEKIDTSLTFWKGLQTPSAEPAPPPAQGSSWPLVIAGLIGLVAVGLFVRTVTLDLRRR